LWVLYVDDLRGARYNWRVTITQFAVPVLMVMVMMWPMMVLFCKRIAVLNGRRIYEFNDWWITVAKFSFHAVAKSSFKPVVMTVMVVMRHVDLFLRLYLKASTGIVVQRRYSYYVVLCDDSTVSVGND